VTERAAQVSPQNQSSFHHKEAAASGKSQNIHPAFFAHSSGVQGYLLLSTKEREKGKLSREGGINGPCA